MTADPEQDPELTGAEAAFVAQLRPTYREHPSHPVPVLSGRGGRRPAALTTGAAAAVLIAAAGGGYLLTRDAAPPTPSAVHEPSDPDATPVRRLVSDLTASWARQTVPDCASYRPRASPEVVYVPRFSVECLARVPLGSTVVFSSTEADQLGGVAWEAGSQAWTTVDGVQVLRKVRGEELSASGRYVQGVWTDDPREYAVYAGDETAAAAVAALGPRLGAPDAAGEPPTQELDLGVAGFDRSAQDPGTLVVSGPWGDGPGEFGIDEQLSGPSSYDVAPDGDVVVLDRVNERLVRISPRGRTSTSAIELTTGAADLAVAPDGSLAVLYASAVDGARVERFAADGGRPLGEIELASGVGNAIRTTGDTTYLEAGDGFWAPVISGGRAVRPEEQTTAGTLGVTDGTQLVTRLHLRETGNRVLVTQESISGARAWWITGTTTLGPVVLAAPLPDGRAVVVQSQFDDTHSQYSVITLDGDRAKVFTVPHEQYAGLYDPSEFRLVGDRLFQLRSTEEGLSVWRYDLSGSR
jgi:hypothetical protein